MDYDYSHEMEYSYFTPYCAECDTTFFYLEESMPGGRSSEAVNCPICGQKLGDAEEDSKLLAQAKGDLSRVDLDEFIQALDDKGRRKLEAAIGTPAQREAEYQEFLEKMKAKSNPSSPTPPTWALTDERFPSEVTDEKWISAQYLDGQYPSHTRDGGKWMVFGSPDAIDDLWDEIKSALQNGKLGSQAKVATAMHDPAYKKSEKVICVYTYDWQDKEDVVRVREALRSLGVTWLCSYKSDEDTRQGNYSVLGHRVGKFGKYRM